MILDVHNLKGIIDCPNLSLFQEMSEEEKKQFGF
jgi:hypothetical protein